MSGQKRESVRPVNRRAIRRQPLEGKFSPRIDQANDLRDKRCATLRRAEVVKATKFEVGMSVDEIGRR